MPPISTASATRASRTVEPLYDGRDVYRTLLRLQAVPYDTPVDVGRGLEATFVDAGHLLGSAMIGLRMDGPEANGV